MKGVLAAALEGMQTFLARLDQDEIDRKREKLRRDRFGTCGWCDEVLHQPIHDTDCPARIAKDEKELMRG